MDSQEEWRVIEEFDNYSVSNKGRIRNDKKGTFIKETFNTFGYHQCRLSKNGITKTLRINRIVAIAFLPNEENLPEIDHINNIRHDNRVENLRWISRSNNLRNMTKRGSCKLFGVSFEKAKNNYKATITIEGFQKTIGRYKTEEEAHQAWLVAVYENGLEEFYSNVLNI
jgi:hypothetical protein